MKKHHEALLENLPKTVKAHIHHLERVRSDFVANVSHELRTPLTVIQGYLETLLKQKTYDAELLQKIFAQMFQQSVRMGSIIQDLLLLSALESDDHPAEEKINVPVAKLLAVLSEEARHIGHIDNNKKHHIILKADKKLLLNGCGNELKSLFSNLIINAIKYTPTNGTITIEWYAEQDHAVFKVTDTGMGIAKKHIPRITERFYRVDKARSRDSGGTGLGLAIVKHILLRHQGRLVVESKLHKGSTFTCIFPAERTIIS